MDFERSFWQSMLSYGQYLAALVQSQSLQEPPSIRSNFGAIDIMRVPGPDGIETFGIEV